MRLNNYVVKDVCATQALYVILRNLGIGILSWARVARRDCFHLFFRFMIKILRVRCAMSVSHRGSLNSYLINLVLAVRLMRQSVGLHCCAQCVIIIHLYFYRFLRYVRFSLTLFSCYIASFAITVETVNINRNQRKTVRYIQVFGNNGNLSHAWALFSCLHFGVMCSYKRNYGVNFG